MRSPVYRLVFSVRSKPTHRRRVEKKRRQKRNFAPLRDSALRSAKEVLLVAAPCCLPPISSSRIGNACTTTPPAARIPTLNYFCHHYSAGRCANRKWKGARQN